MRKIIYFFLIFSYFCSCKNKSDSYYKEALENGIIANEGLNRCNKYVDGWLVYSDSITGLIPRNLNADIDKWNANDAACDNYPFMVLTTSITDQAKYNSIMLKILETEKRLTSRIGTLPDTYSFTKKTFEYKTIDTGRIIFGTSEYMKDGLIPITEYLGMSQWTERMIEMLDELNDIIEIATNIKGTYYGNSPEEEINGDLLQVLSRIYMLTGNSRYLEWATKIGDYYLLGNHHPTKDLTKLRLRDHGGEIVEGLCELYVVVSYVLPEKKKEYQAPLYLMLDRILEIGRNKHGLFYDEIDPKNGKIISNHLADTWGYLLDGYYSVYLIDKKEEYKQATLKVLENLNSYYKNYNWEDNSSDGFADAIEGALNLYNREPIESVANWINSEILEMWKKQKESGIIEGWHGDGNFARTSLLYCLWKSQGIKLKPWRKDLILGAVKYDTKIFVTLKSENNWEGLLTLDTERHKEFLNMPIDYPRINQFPEWFTIKREKKYIIKNKSTNKENFYKGEDLLNGITLSIKKNELLHLEIELKN